MGGGAKFGCQIHPTPKYYRGAAGEGGFKKFPRKTGFSCYFDRKFPEKHDFSAKSLVIFENSLQFLTEKKYPFAILFWEEG